MASDEQGFHAIGNGRMPKSLEKLLTVGTPEGARSTTVVPKSKLLAKLNAFLPELNAANEALLSEDVNKLGSIPGPTIVSPKEKSELGEGDNQTHSENNDADPVIHMDVYIDEELGHLVPNAESPVVKAKEQPLIEVVDDGKDKR